MARDRLRPSHLLLQSLPVTTWRREKDRSEVEIVAGGEAEEPGGAGAVRRKGSRCDPETAAPSGPDGT